MSNFLLRETLSNEWHLILFYILITEERGEKKNRKEERNFLNTKREIRVHCCFFVVVVVNSAASIIQSHPLIDFSHLLQSHSFSFTTPQRAVGKYTAKKTTHKHKKTRRKKSADWNTYRSNNESQDFIGWFRIEPGGLRECISHFPSTRLFSCRFHGARTCLQHLEQLGSSQFYSVRSQFTSLRSVPDQVTLYT